jgi:hypothetical protein
VRAWGAYATWTRTATAGDGTLGLPLGLTLEPLALCSGRQEYRSMLWTIAVILLVLWLLGFSLHIAGGLIHILLVVALVVGLIQLFSGRRAV